MFTFSQLFIILLMVDAAWVAYGLIKKKIMWKWICLYWILLTIKNACDYFHW